MNDLIRQASERREALLRELEELDTFLRVAAWLSSRPRAYASGSLGISASIKPHGANSVAARTVSLAREKIVTAGRPLPLRALYEALKDEVEIGGKDALATLSARLSNSDELKSHRGMGWWVTDRPLPSLFQPAQPATITQEAAGAGQSNPAASLTRAQEDDHEAALAEPTS